MLISPVSILALFLCGHSLVQGQHSVMGWTVSISTDWDVLGPFPIHAREQQFLSSSFPLNASEPIDFSAQWPSSYADNGKVGWSKTTMDDAGVLRISFPDIRWKSLRATEGWAALQHHAVLKSTITVNPPESANESATEPQLLVNLAQGSYFAILPKDDDEKRHSVPRWIAGNIYAIERAVPAVVQLPVSPSTTSPTEYDIFVSGDYEIRLFGDPTVQGSEIPVQTITLTMEIESTHRNVVREASQDIICDFVDGQAFGSVLGVGFRSVSGWWTVMSVNAANSTATESMSLELVRQTRLAPGQTRITPIRLAHSGAYIQENITMDVTLEDSDGVSITVPVSLAIRQLPLWNESSYATIRAAYLYGGSMPTIFSLVPPKLPSQRTMPILALHGAGVDITSNDFWADAMPRNQYSWFILPTGRTSWGLDWHGPSATDAWASVEAATVLLAGNEKWKDWTIAANTQVFLLGHSNGGQGAWWIAERYPDRVAGVAAAAAYVKSQQYIPLALSRSAHFVDPALRAILESSLTADDNDLFTTNLIGMPVLAIHGGDDENVPVWHSRELVSTLQTWSPTTNVSLYEAPGQPHFFDTVFKNDIAETFIGEVLRASKRDAPDSFTLTVAIPVESQTLHGWRVERLTIPGRLARLFVNRENSGVVNVVTSNVASFSINTSQYPFSSIQLDGISLSNLSGGTVRFETVEPRTKMWRIVNKVDKIPIQPSGRMQRILASTGFLTLVIPDRKNHHALSVALRIAHDLNTYHKLDAEIIESSETTDTSKLLHGDVVVIGNKASELFGENVRAARSPLEATEHQVVINGNTEPALKQPGLGLVYLHPHPLLEDGKILFVQSTDAAGLERAAKLFPIRTGIAVPDWIIASEKVDSMGSAGVVGAGIWGSNWDWNEASSWNL